MSARYRHGDGICDIKSELASRVLSKSTPRWHLYLIEVPLRVRDTDFFCSQFTGIFWEWNPQQRKRVCVCVSVCVCFFCCPQKGLHLLPIRMLANDRQRVTSPLWSFTMGILLTLRTIGWRWPWSLATQILEMLPLVAWQQIEGSKSGYSRFIYG